MSNKTITIQQGTGDDALEMTVQVTQEELDKMEEIRSKDPSAWEGRGLDLVKAAKEAVIIETSEKRVEVKKHINWKLLLGVSLLGLIIVGTVIFAEHKNKKPVEADVQCAKPNEANGMVITSVNKRELLYDYLMKNDFIASGSKEDFFAYIEDEERRMILYKDMNDLGIFSQDDFYSHFGQRNNTIGCYNDFCTFLGYPYYNHHQPKTENMEKTYNKLLKLGSKGSFEQFIEFFEENDDNKKKVYEKLKDTGYLGTYDDFLEYVGYKTNNTDNQSVIDLYNHLHEKKLFNGSIDDFKNSLMSESYRNSLYQFLSEKQVFDGSYYLFNKEINISTNYIPIRNNHKRTLFDILTLYGYDLGDYETFSQKMNDEKKRRIFYDAVSEEYDIGSWEEFSNKVVDSPKNSDFSVVSSQLMTFSSKQYNFTYQYDDNTLKLVEKTNKNSHCVMKLQSPNDEVKSILVSVWENPEFSSSYDTDFVSSCQSVDEGMGKVINSAVKTKVDGVNALKSELIISPMGKSYYAAIYRIIHKKRMYMLNIYIPIEEYNKDKSYGDKCANNFKFN